MTAKKNPQQPELFDTPYQLAEIQVSYKPKVKASDRPKVTCSDDAHKLFRSVWADDICMRERVYMMVLNRARYALGVTCLAIGGRSGAYIDHCQALAIAMKGNGASIIVAHNHPSNETKPSKQDFMMTKKLYDAGKIVGIDVDDHLILDTGNKYHSIADNEGMSLC